MLLNAASARAASEEFGVESVAASLSNSQAGAHGDYELQFRLKREPTKAGEGSPWAPLRNLAIELPPGLIGNLAHFPTCGTNTFLEQTSALSDPSVPLCPIATQVGLLSPGLEGILSAPPGEYRTPLYNLERPPGNRNVVARLGAISLLYPLFVDIRLDPKRNDSITAELVNASALAGLTGANTTLWAVPADPAHDDERLNWIEAAKCGRPCNGPVAVDGPPLAVLANSTSCEAGPTGVETTSYADSAGGDRASTSLGVTGCEQVPFAPTLSMQPSTRTAGESSGMSISLRVPQEGLPDPYALRSADLRRATVHLPAGVTLNSSVANGLAACSEAEIGFDPNERQFVNLGASGAPTRLSLAGKGSAELPQLASAGEVRAALEALPMLEAGDVAVRGRRGGPWQVDFGGSMEGDDVPTIEGVHSELQRLVVRAGGGSYALDFGGEVTAPLPYNAGAAEIEAALEALPAVAPGDLAVSGAVLNGGGTFRIAFGGRFTDADVASLVPVTSLTGVNSFAAAAVLAQGGSPVAVETVEQGGSLRFDGAEPSCPDESKIASGSIVTPLLSRPIRASVYLAEQGANPFGATFGAYLVAAGDGVVLKVAGRFAVDERTGEVSVEFESFPQLPIESMALEFKGGLRGLLTLPRECGTYRSTYDLRSWSGAAAAGASEFAIDRGCEGSSSTTRFTAGSTRPVAGAYSSLALQIVRDARLDPMSRLAVDLPPGLAAKLAGVDRCPDAVLEVAGPRAPACPASSQVGTVTVGTGAGLPTYLDPGSVFLGGPYESAPFSLAFSVPARSGPFDLGTVLVRAAVRLDRSTGALRLVSDPIPAKVAGVPLDVRDLRILVDRPGFMINPTDCEESAVRGAIESANGEVIDISDRFQVGDCAALPFRPVLGVSFKGALGRNGHPTIVIAFSPGAGDAGISRAAVALPAGELLDLRRIRAFCERDLPPDGCPRASRLGYVHLRTPLLEHPLHGAIYLQAAAAGRLPDVVADLRADQIRLVLHGHLGAKAGRLKMSFPRVPDIPFSRGRIVLAGGRAGMVVNSESLCNGSRRAAAAFSAHNGMSRRARPSIRLVGTC